MKTLYGYRDIAGKLKDPVAAIGIFDGIHLGHKRVINKVIFSTVAGQDRVVITFDPHPQAVLDPGKNPPRIMSLDHRLSMFEKMGVDATVVIRFTDFIASMSPEEFIKRVLVSTGAKKIFVGNNFHFGSGKSGNVQSFKDLGKKYGISVNAVGPVKKRGRVVSSTWLRSLIIRGDIEKAENLLRRPVSVLGIVVAGDSRGKELGVPTANIDPHHEVIPPPGVYAVKVDVGGELFDGVLNIGFKPTFYGRKLKKRKEPHIEVHINGFDGDLYGHTLEVFFIKRLRREKKFKNEDALKKQIAKDNEIASKVLSGKRVVHKIRKYKSL
ncbi:MAG: bifunctional riboflavin kinase/FAD synthetase [Candidatus Tantalella remota]|nr:bifunctional riboflavin kinase/FAD synthetase [Candidatus Tantalella remota]